MIENKDHWYDGWFYDKFISPNQDRLFSEIKSLIDPSSTVVDIGCGTGRLSFTLFDKCSWVLGIDLSKRNIDQANYLLSRNPLDNVSFRHMNIEELLLSNKYPFDYAVLTYVIHEVHEYDRIELLQNISKVAEIIIVGDYLVPSQSYLWKFLNEMVEFAAGKEHYRNYKNFISNGGIKDLAKKSGLNIIREIKNRPSTSHLVFLSK
jgi:SAM-dependent methyltransferase